MSKKEYNEFYNNYPVEVQEYMNNVIKCLQEDYGNIPESWRVSLDLIADNYMIYLDAKKDVLANGLSHTDNYGRTGKNPSLGVMNQAQRNLTDLLKAFALTPMSKSKMRNLNTSVETADEYIEDLLS